MNIVGLCLSSDLWHLQWFVCFVWIRSEFRLSNVIHRPAGYIPWYVYYLFIVILPLFCLERCRGWTLTVSPMTVVTATADDSCSMFVHHTRDNIDPWLTGQVDPRLAGQVDPWLAGQAVVKKRLLEALWTNEIWSWPIIFRQLRNQWVVISFLKKTENVKHCGNSLAQFMQPKYCLGSKTCLCDIELNTRLWNWRTNKQDFAQLTFLFYQDLNFNGRWTSGKSGKTNINIIVFYLTIVTDYDREQTCHFNETSLSL